MNDKLRKYLETVGLRAEATEAEAWAHLAGLNADQKRAATDILTDRAALSVTLLETGVLKEGVDPVVVANEAVRAERTRVSTLRTLAGADVPNDVVERAIADGWDENRAAREFLTVVRTARPAPLGGGGPGIHSHSHEGSCTERVLCAAMVLRAGQTPIDASAPEARRKEQEAIAEQAHAYRNMSMEDICREAIRLSGQRVPIGRDEVIERAVSTASLSNIFTSSVQARLISTFQGIGDTTEGWVSVVDVPNFKMNEVIQTGQSSNLEKLPRGTTAKDATVADKLESYKIARYAKKFTIDEQDIVDDNFGALLEMPTKMGAAAARMQPDLVYAILLANAALADGTALFHANHGNLGTGGGSALGEASIQAGTVAMGKQTDGDAQLNLPPVYILVPQDLKFKAKEFISSTQIIMAGTAGSVTTRGNANTIADLNLQTRIDNRLSATGVIDPSTKQKYVGSATNWFFVTDPLRCPTIEVAYLRGSNRAPRIRSYVLSQGNYGIGWDVSLDVGAKALDFRGVYKANGA